MTGRTGHRVGHACAPIRGRGPKSWKSGQWNGVAIKNIFMAVK
jgi:hypothetical protein